MFRNNLKVALRYLTRHKGYTTINAIGLAVGVACCILIMLFVRSEWSYDRFHTKADRLYRVWQHEKYEGEDFINSVTPLPLASAVQSSFPEVEATCRIFGFSPMVKVDQRSFSEEVRMVDSTFFRMFDFELLEGDRNRPFPTSHSVILTPALATKYFGKQNPVGRNIEMQLGNEKILFAVAGIVKPSPEASSIKYKLLIPYSNSKFLFSKNAHKSWFNVFGETYVLLRNRVSASRLEAKFPSMMKQQLGENYVEGGFVLHLQPIADIHLNKDIPAGIEPVSNPKYSYILATIGGLLLLVACINFITLSIGRSATRAMEVGVRKALGAYRRQLVRQFWGEAFLLTLASVIVGLILAMVLVKPFNLLIDRELSIRFDILFVFFCLLMIGLIALVAGIYPAFILSGFNPVEVLKGKLKLKSNSGWFRKSLVIGQFVASIALIICTVVIGEQMNYLKTKDLGYNKEQVVVVPTNKGRGEGTSLAQVYRAELLKHPQVADVGISLFSFAENSWVELGFTNDKKVYKGFQYNAVDAPFIKTMGLQVIQGRAFDATNVADLTTAAIVNEAFVREFGLVDPVGKKLPGKFDQQIIGVVKDFNFQSLHNEVRPLLLTMMPDSVFRRTENISFAYAPQPRVSIRLRAGNIADHLEILKQAWKQVAPSQDFEYRFLDEVIAAQYEQEQRTSTIVKLASALSIFIACMGLFGLATLAVARRTKEIGIRKVLGASVTSIISLLSKEFVRLIIIAAFIAFPLAWWFTSGWLKDFAYRVSVGWWMYILAALVTLLIALVTIGLQAIKAALTNPVKSLRTE